MHNYDCTHYLNIDKMYFLLKTVEILEQEEASRFNGCIKSSMSVFAAMIMATTSDGVLFN